MNTDTIRILQKTLTIMVAFPFALQLWSFFISNRYKCAALNIHTTQRELFRSIKLRYTNSAKLGIPLLDTESFVSKYFYGKGGPFNTIHRLERVGAILQCFSLLGTTAFYIRGYCELSRMIAFVSASICFYIFRSALSSDKQMTITISFTKDYLDNTLKHRVSPEPLRNVKSDTSTTPIQNIEKVAQPEKVINQTTANADITNTPQSNEKIIDISRSLINENSEIIEAVLQEFLA